MHLRRSLALGALLLTVPLTSCGFDLATDRVNTISPGATNRDATVDVLNAVIVSADEGSGVLVATLVNNDGEATGTVDAITSGDEAVQVGEFTPIEVDPDGAVNLAAADQEGIGITGELAAGDSIPMTIEISGGQVLEVEVPVVPNCGEFAGIDGEGAECEIAEPVGEH